MRTVSAAATARSAEIVRNNLRDTEESFGEDILTAIACKLWPKPNTAAQIATELGCSVRNVELYLSGKQKWSGDAVAVIVAEILRRHHMRNFKVTKRV